MKKTMIFGLLLCAMATEAFSQKNDGIFSFKVGSYEVFMLVEAQRKGNGDILIADKSLIKRFMPLFGFFHSTNTFLIKTPDRNILVDTGFGQAIFEHLKKLNVAPEEIDAVLITHLHGDHFGGLAKEGKALFPKAKIYLSSQELEYWTKTNVNQGAVAALSPYGSEVETFDPPQLDGNLIELLEGITPIANFGHTPGHTVFLVENGGEKFLIIGDLLHIALVQFSLPEISATYDSDAKAAAEVRREILSYAANNKIPVGGMHIVYPGTGMVEAEGNGFKFVPAK